MRVTPGSQTVRIRGLRSNADLREIVRAAARDGAGAAFIAAWDRRHLAPAMRSMGPDAEAWVARQMAKRAAYIAQVAELLGLDPDEAARRWQAGTL